MPLGVPNGWVYLGPMGRARVVRGRVVQGPWSQWPAAMASMWSAARFVPSDAAMSAAKRAHHI